MHCDDPLRIALWTYSTQPRGGVLHVLALAQALLDLGHEPVVYAPDDTGHGFIRTPRCAHVLIDVAPKRDALLPFVNERIAALVGGWNRATPVFDVHHAHDGITGNALATLAQQGAIGSFARTVHHLDTFDSADLTALQNRSIIAAERCFVVSEVWRERIAERYGIAAAVVPNGVDCARFTPASPARRQLRRSAAMIGDGPVFVTIGGIEERKNTFGLLEGFARVRSARPSARLIIAGGASVLDHSVYRRMFEARALELGLQIGTDISLTGVLPDEDIVALLQAADAFVFPSFVEGFGLVLLEALACAVPVITSDIAPFTEFLQPADAQLVDPRDPVALAAAMLRALEPDVAAAAAARGLAIAKRYSWAESARAHVALYRSIAAARSAIYA